MTLKVLASVVAPEADNVVPTVAALVTVNAAAVTVPVKLGLARGALAARSVVRLVTPDSAIAGISAATKALNVGAAAVVPLTGPAHTRLADCVAKAPVSVPVDVTGDPLTVMMLGSERATEETYESDGMSALTRVLNVGAAAVVPDVGPANTLLADCVLSVNEPEAVPVVVVKLTGVA